MEDVLAMSALAKARGRNRRLFEVFRLMYSFIILGSSSSTIVTLNFIDLWLVFVRCSYSTPNLAFAFLHDPSHDLFSKPLVEIISVQSVYTVIVSLSCQNTYLVV